MEAGVEAERAACNLMSRARPLGLSTMRPSSRNQRVWSALALRPVRSFFALSAQFPTPSVTSIPRNCANSALDQGFGPGSSGSRCMTRFLRGGLEVTQKESSPPPGSPPAASTWHDGIGLRWLGCDDACVFFECWRYIPAELGVALALMDLVVIVDASWPDSY